VRARTPPPPEPPAAASVRASVRSRPEKSKPEDLEGKTFESVRKNRWTFGKLLGTGGFGAIYEVKDKPELVIKTGLKDGKDSGVFLEKAVYMKLKDPKGDKNGIPQIVDSGKLPSDVREKDYFIIMPRFEVNLEDLIKTNTMTPEDRKKVMYDVLNALQHLSKKKYLHLDIKAENIMKKDGRWYLIDYGMVERFDDRSETTIDPKKACNGTAWFMSRDAHKGLMSRRADLESFVYILVQMEGHKLPWLREKNKNEKDKDYLSDIFNSKEEFFNTYKDLNLPEYVNTFIEYVNKLQPGEDPEYDALKSQLETKESSKKAKKAVRTKKVE